MTLFYFITIKNFVIHFSIDSLNWLKLNWVLDSNEVQLFIVLGHAKLICTIGCCRKGKFKLKSLKTPPVPLIIIIKEGGSLYQQPFTLINWIKFECDVHTRFSRSRLMLMMIKNNNNKQGYTCFTMIWWRYILRMML